MKNFVKVTILATLLMTLAVVSLASDYDTQFCKNSEALGFEIDRLLLDTAHVYVRASDNVIPIYIPEIGFIFYGNISMTSTAGLSFKFSSSSDLRKQMKSEDEFDSEKFKEDMKELSEDMAELSEEFKSISEVEEVDKEALAQLQILSKLSNLKKLSHVPALYIGSAGFDGDSDRITKLKLNDEERINTMQTHLDQFKNELMDLIIKNQDKIRGLDTKEEICVVFSIREPEFKEKFGSDKLITRITVNDLTNLKGFSSADERVQKVFKFNI